MNGRNHVVAFLKVDAGFHRANYSDSQVRLTIYCFSVLFTFLMMPGVIISSHFIQCMFSR